MFTVLVCNNISKCFSAIFDVWGNTVSIYLNIVRYLCFIDMRAVDVSWLREIFGLLPADFVFEMYLLNILNSEQSFIVI